MQRRWCLCYNRSMLKLLPKKVLLFFSAVSVGLGVVSRVAQLNYPSKYVFDEVYFPVFAAKLLKGELSFDVHPPLGKMLITVGIWLLGDKSIGWRLVPCLFGLATIAIFVLLWRAYVRRVDQPESESLDPEGLSTGSFILASIVALECFLVVYSRIGLMDGVLLFFILAGFWLACRGKGAADYIGASLFFGLAVAIKWLALGLLVPMLFIYYRSRKLGKAWPHLAWGVLVYVLIVWLGQVIGHIPHPFQSMLRWHDQALSYHVALKETHPWGSMWWSWPYMQRPLLMFYETVNSKLSVITAIGNPWLWWSATLSVAASTVYLLIRGLLGGLRKISDHFLFPLLLGYYSFWLPWYFVDRVIFIYHYLPSYAFALLILNYWLVRLWKRSPWLVLLFLLVAFVMMLYFLPLVTGWPISKAYLDQHIWIKSWL